MKGGSRSAGYTIVEVMIVLAVSSVMFLIAATFVSGKQAKAAFTEGTNEFSSQLQTVISQVNSGQYSDVGLSCTYNPLSHTTVVGLGGANGKNPSCIFLGKVIYFASKAYNLPNYEVLSLAGGRVDGSGLAPGTSITPADEAPAAIDALTLQQDVPQSLDVSSVKSVDTGGGSHTDVGIAILQGLGSIDSAGDVAGGAQAPSLYIVSGMIPGMSVSSQDNVVGNGGNYVPAQSVTVCLTDGARYATLTLGGTAAASNPNGNTLSVVVKVVTTC